MSWKDLEHRGVRRALQRGGEGRKMGPLGRVEDVFGRNKRKQLAENGAFGRVMTDKVGKLG